MYAVVDVGCIECSEETILVGLYEDKEEAVARARKEAREAKEIRHRRDHVVVLEEGVPLDASEEYYLSCGHRASEFGNGGPCRSPAQACEGPQ